jgi:hypothetical protein
MTWADDRARLNHDVLSNYVENELLSLQSRPADEPARLKQFLQREGDFVSFLDRSVDALSYACVFDQPRFDAWPSPIRQDIRLVAHGLFVAYSGIPVRVSELKKALAETLSATRQFFVTPPGERAKDQVHNLRTLVARLRDGISALPRNPGEEVPGV